MRHDHTAVGFLEVSADCHAEAICNIHGRDVRIAYLRIDALDSKPVTQSDTHTQSQACRYLEGVLRTNYLVEYLGGYQNSGSRKIDFDALLALPQSRAAEAAPPTLKRARRLKPDEVAEMAKAYESGATVYALADNYDINRRTAADLLRKHGVELRYRKLSDEQLAEAKRLHAEGWSYVLLGERYDVNQSTIGYALRRSGESSVS